MMAESIIDGNDKFCKRCHRKLKDDKSMELGFGPVCYQKYMNRRKNYLFNLEKSTTTLSRDDVVKFNEFYKHYNQISPNIGIVGDKDYFKKRITAILKTKEYTKLVTNEELTRYTLFFGNMEETYISVSEISDLENTFFKKFI